MRTLGRLFIGLIVLGLILGFMLRGRWPRHQLRWVIAVAFVPALLHLAVSASSARAEGIEFSLVGLYLVVVLASVAAAWWYAVRLAPTRPGSAALMVPVQALLQGLATGALERAVIVTGAAVDPVATAAFGGAAILLGTALLVILPTRAHFPWLPRAPDWWVALLRARGRR